MGIPYFLLATNSTLMQAWFSRDHAQQTPYRLYALSNAGSLVALVSYPLIFEPLLTLRTQAYLWTAGYTLFVAVAAWLAWANHWPGARSQSSRGRRKVSLARKNAPDSASMPCGLAWPHAPPRCSWR
ncbi:MAG: hypothetical protein IPM84_27065 [Anaerolineae bacterium]|nr:hypothetical protein [Anaerolineae bacterium]